MNHSSLGSLIANLAMPHRLPLLCGILGFSLVACSPTEQSTDQSSLEPNLLSVGIGGSTAGVIIDPNQGGQASALRIEEVRWGRLVDVYDANDADGNPATPPIRFLIYREFLIGEDILSDGVDYLLETNPITAQAELTILADSDSNVLVSGTSETQAERFERLRDMAVSNLGFVPPTGIDPSFTPPFPTIPRNAAASIRFSDLLDDTSVDQQTVRLVTGVPAIQPFSARVLADPNYGALVQSGSDLIFRSTRVIVDFTVSEVESMTSPLPVNAIGLPSSPSANFANAVLRFPTTLNPSVGQFQIVRNLAGNSLDFANNGPVDSNLTMDVVRAFRSGQSSSSGQTTSDPNNGFLLDTEAPQLVGSQPIAMTSAPKQVKPKGFLGDARSDVSFLINYEFANANCAQPAKVGDVVRMQGTSFVPELFAVVTRPSSISQSGQASPVRVRLLKIPATVKVRALIDDFKKSTTGRLEATFVPGPEASADCFVTISPTPGLPPLDLISTTPAATVRFSEPIDPDSVTPHDSFRIDRVMASAPGPNTSQSIVGNVLSTPDLHEFRFTPLTPLDHVSGTSEELFLTVLGGAKGAKDLAGNSLAEALPGDLRLTIDPAEATTRSGGIVLTFDQLDEDGNTPAGSSPGSVFPEIRGQFIRDLNTGTVLSREVTRSSHVIDEQQPLVSAMVVTGAPVANPLVPLGSRMMTVWRNVDMGISILDESTANLDIEGLNYAPFAGQVSNDFFSGFEISLAHSAKLPDEFPIPLTQGGGGYAMFQNSGLSKVFNDNLLDDPLNTGTVVHNRTEGYFLSQTQAFTSSTGTVMMPFPLNRNGEPVSDYDYYTWRDTAVLAKGGAQGGGADVKALVSLGYCNTNIPTVYNSGEVRSLGLPLLMEFKCFADNQANGLNGISTRFALPTHRFPVFRAFSSGGFLASGAAVQVNPDAATNANGGFNPSNGQPTPGDDNTVMLGQVDTVVRVSRMHTIWFDTLQLSGSGTPSFLAPVVEPSANQLPAGTSIQLEFRGADDIQTVTTQFPPVVVPATASADAGNALKYDAYGDPLETRIFADPGDDNCPVQGTLTRMQADFQPVFTNGDATWHSDLSDLDGARFIQARVTFVANTADGQRPTLSTLAIAFDLD